MFDVVIAGAGHNGLVAAAYLARAGKSVLLLERFGHVGGLAVSAQAFPGVDARVSRYSYLVSLLPSKVVKDLGLPLTLRAAALLVVHPGGNRRSPGGRRRRGPHGRLVRQRHRGRPRDRRLAALLRHDGRRRDRRRARP